MKLFVVPPHADFTLAWTPPEGFESLDLARGFAERVAGGPAIPEALAAIAGSTEPAACRRRVSLEVARALLSRGHSARTHLRALGAAFSGLCPPGAGVRLRLDDLELEQGTTERGSDALEASRAALPYAKEIDQAVEAGAGASTVRLWLERDQQLPAALAIAARLSVSALELAGPFASVHRQALAPLFPTARWVEADAAARLLGAPGAPAAGWTWDARDPNGWAGRLGLRDLLETDPAASGLRVAILAFAAWDEEVVAADGWTAGRAAVEAAVDRARLAGVRVVGEWWVGAPGVGAERNARTVLALRSAPLDGLAGVRPFHWTRGRRGTRFGALEVQVLSAPHDRDLWRSHPFAAQGTLSPDALAQALEALPVQLLAQGCTLSPGRLAQACVAEPAPSSVGERIGIDPDCALVSVPLGIDGQPGPLTYAVNLRNGVTLAVDPRLVPAVRSLESAVPASAALAALGGRREQVLRALLAKGVLAEVA